MEAKDLFTHEVLDIGLINYIEYSPSIPFPVCLSKLDQKAFKEENSAKIISTCYMLYYLVSFMHVHVLMLRLSESLHGRGGVLAMGVES